MPKNGTRGSDELDALAKALRAVRKRAGLSKEDLRVGLTDSGYVLVQGERGGTHTSLRARTADDVLDSFDDDQDFWEHAIWKSAEPRDLRRWFKEARREGSSSAQSPVKASKAAQETKQTKHSKPPASLEEARERARRNWTNGLMRPSWKKATNGKPDRSVYPLGGFDLILRAVDHEVRAAMSKAVLLSYIACCEEADLSGQFEMPAGTLGNLIGCNRRNAQRALDTLLKSSVMRIIYPGGPKKPNVYGFTPAAKFSKERAIEALKTARAASAASADRARIAAADAKAKAKKKNKKTAVPA